MIRTSWARNLAVLKRLRPVLLRRVSQAAGVENDPKEAEDSGGEKHVEEDHISTPWYLRSDIKSALIEEKEVEIPDVPADAPAHVEEFLKLLATDYGMEELLLFDMTKLDDSHEFRSNNSAVDYILIGTGKSERHNFKAASELRNHIKHQYNVIPLVEGMVANGKTPAQRRRLLRRARKGPSATDNEYGKAANSWVLFHHGNVDVHLMTAQRRQELNLESLWCSEEDLPLYEVKQATISSSDHIFSGIRRLHTTASLMSKTHLHTLREMPCSTSAEELSALKSQFERDQGDSNEKVSFLKTLHCLNPHVVSFQEVENALFEKHSSMDTDTSLQKSDDVTEYLKLLIDTPTEASATSTDLKFDRLSKFISSLYGFSLDRFSMTANPDFIPLLWRLTYTATNSITPKTVSDAVNLGAVAFEREPSDMVFSSNNARNVLTLLDYHTQKVEPSQITADFKELVLFTYGNAGKWERFWGEWEGMHFPQALDSAQAVSKWVRLAVFLAMTSNEAQALHFLNTYWRNSTSVSGSFLEALERNNGFNSEAEKWALVLAVLHLVGLFDCEAKPAFEGIKRTLHSFK